MKDIPFIAAIRNDELELVEISYFKNSKHFYKNKPYWSIVLEKNRNNYNNLKDQLEYFMDNLQEENNYILIPCSCIGTCGILKFTSYSDGESVSIYADYYTQRKLNQKHLTIPIHYIQLEYILEELK